MFTLTPTEEELQHWMRTFVPESMLWLWDDAPLPSSTVSPQMVPRAELRHHPVTGRIDIVNAFQLWAIPHDVRDVILDDGTWFASLDDSAKAEVRRKQAMLNRGLCIPVDRLSDVEDIVCSVTFNGRVVLDHSLWTSLSEETRRNVILTELPLWDDAATWPVPSGTPDHISEIANRFVLQDGVNCFSVAAYAVTADENDLMHWMQQERFQELIDANRYEVVAGPAIEPGDVLIFLDERLPVHAAYALTSERILNKSGQSSFNPIRVIEPAMLIQEWADYQIRILRRLPILADARMDRR